MVVKQVNISSEQYLGYLFQIWAIHQISQHNLYLSWVVDKINFYGIQRFLNPDKLLPIGSLSMETFVALSICPNFQATVLSEPNTNVTVLQNTAIKTNFQLTSSTKVNPGYNRVYERFHQIRNLQHLL